MINYHQCDLHKPKESIKSSSSSTWPLSRDRYYSYYLVDECYIDMDSGQWIGHLIMRERERWGYGKRERGKIWR